MLRLQRILVLKITITNITRDHCMTMKVYRALGSIFIWAAIAIAQTPQNPAQGRLLWQFNTGG
jgi:hypothetical protein